MTNVKVCIECGSEWVVNQKYRLCQSCNFKRLHGKSEFEFSRDSHKNIPSVSKRGVRQIDKDEETYRAVFNLLPNVCQECGTELPDVFRDENGKIVARFQYSHILGKQSHPEFRNEVRNFNRVCMVDHDNWEFGEKESMKIFKQNQETIQILYNERSSESIIK